MTNTWGPFMVLRRRVWPQLQRWALLVMPTHVSSALSASPGHQQVNRREVRRVTRRSLRPHRHPQTELSPGEAASISGLSGRPGTVLSLPAGQHPSPVPLAPDRSETCGTAAQDWDTACGSGVWLPLCRGYTRMCACECRVGLCCVCLIPVTSCRQSS